MSSQERLSQLTKAPFDDDWRGHTRALAEIADVLGGETVLRQRIDSRLDLIALSCKGVPKEALLQLAHFLSCTIHDVVGLLPVTERTLQRYAPQQLLSRVVSEHILQLAEVAARGVEVFGDMATFLAWLRQPSTALANYTPLNLLSSRFGAELVLDGLGRLEHGVVA
jgi:putative toxin-antitoxin system antitoxin component (TIGR02293 family)